MYICISIYQYIDIYIYQYINISVHQYISTYLNILYMFYYFIEIYVLTILIKLKLYNLY